MNRRNILVILATLAAILSGMPSGAGEPADWESCLAAPSNECMLSLARNLATAESDAPLRADLLSRIAVAQTEAGRTAEARKTMQLAEKASRATGPDEYSHFGDLRALAWAEAARGWMKTGNWENAARMIEDAPDKEAQLHVIQAIGKSWLEAGDIGAALDLARGAKRPESRLWLLPEIAKAQIEAGDMAAARNTFVMLRDAANELPNAESRVFYLAALGKLQAEAGMIEEAMQTAAGITGFANHDWLARQIAMAHASSGEFDAASETLGLIEGKVALVLGYARVGAIAVMADERDLAEDFFAEGLTLARATVQGKDRDNAIGRVAWHRAEAGDHDRAVELLVEIEAADIRDWITRIVVGETVKRGGFDKAVSAATSLGDLVHRARAYTEIAAAQATSGDDAAADTAFALALETAKEIPAEITREGVYSFIVEEQAKASDFAGAFKTAEALKDTGDLNRALAEIAVQMARTGDIPGAMDMLRRVGPITPSADALVRIASPGPGGQ